MHLNDEAGAIVPGTLVGGRYAVVELAGRGSMSEVYRAHDDMLGRDVALKVLPANSERVRREVRATGRLSHSNIVALYDTVEYEGRLCLVQEWMPYGSLNQVLARKGKLDLAEALVVGIDVANALSYAHAHGILHRDIKPSNVMLNGDGHYRLVDFGAVGLLSRETGTTATGEIAGTPLYMAPEQFAGLTQTPATDVYGLGLLLYRCLYGELPGHLADGFVGLYRSRSTTIPVPPSALQGLLERCLAPDPDDRPSSAAAVIDELLANRSSRDINAVGSAPTRPAPRPGLAEAPARSLRSSPIVGAVLLALVVPLVWAFVASGPVAFAGVAVGAALAAVALLAAWRIRDRWADVSPDTQRRAAGIVLGTESRDELTRSLVVEVDEVVRRLDSVDARFLGMTIRAMIREYERSKQSSDRQAALINVVTLMEKVETRLAPWHVRHKDALASGVAVVGCLAGVASAVAGFIA